MAARPWHDVSRCRRVRIRQRGITGPFSVGAWLAPVAVFGEAAFHTLGERKRGPLRRAEFQGNDSLPLDAPRLGCGRSRAVRRGHSSAGVRGEVGMRRRAILGSVTMGLAMTVLAAQGPSVGYRWELPPGVSPPRLLAGRSDDAREAGRAGAGWARAGVYAALAASPVYALAAFRRSIVSFRSPYDHCRFHGDEAALHAGGTSRDGDLLFAPRGAAVATWDIPCRPISDSTLTAGRRPRPVRSATRRCSCSTTPVSN